jgi:hypothetical protein
MPHVKNPPNTLKNTIFPISEPYFIVICALNFLKSYFFALTHQTLYEQIENTRRY